MATRLRREAMAPGRFLLCSVVAGFDRLHGDDVSKPDDLHIFSERGSRLGAEGVKGEAGDKAQARIADVERTNDRRSNEAATG
jgi:hypothetical protein